MLPYSAMMPTMLRNATPSAGMMPQMPHWPMTLEGGQPSMSVAGSQPSAVHVTAGGALATPAADEGGLTAATAGNTLAATSATSAPASPALMRSQLMAHLGLQGMAPSMAEMIGLQHHAGGFGMPIAQALPSMLPGMMSGMPMATALAIDSPQLPLQASSPTVVTHSPVAQQQAVAVQRVGAEQAGVPVFRPRVPPTSTVPFTGRSANA